MRHIVACCLVIVVLACATTVRPTPTVIAVLSDRYVVDALTFDTPAAVRAYLVARQVREVRVAPERNVSYARVEQMFIALRDLGLSFGIVGSESPRAATVD